MATIELVPAFTAFEDQLKTLCLNEFPCGKGSWRESSKQQPPLKPSTVEKQFPVTLKDYDPHFEKTETLEEYVGSKFSPWHLDYSWSNESKQLRDIAVKSPWMINNKFILNYFRTLRISNKNVTEVDALLLQFNNLEELTLSANYIVTINSRNLPSKLKVLELCANQISDISSLCIKPPPLTHLGLGYNRITNMEDYLTGDYWPELLSLDLSHNNLSDLMDIIRKLGTLPKLRNLILQGNPLSFVPGYRGYTIDSLRKVNLLDDIRISADERHHFKGLARRREFILDEAKVILEVPYLKGVPMPEEMKFPEDQPEYPVIERKYFVQFMFLEDKTSKGEIFQILHDDLEEMQSPRDTIAGDDKQLDDPQSHTRASITDQSELSKNVNFAERAEVMTSPEQLSTVFPSLPPEDGVVSHCSSRQEENTGPPECPLKLIPIRSESSSWMEEMELDWTVTLVRDDLTCLRDFFKVGMEVAIMEEKVACIPADQLESGGISSPTGSTKAKKKEDGKSANKGDKKKDDKAKGDKDDGKKKKKKGEPEEELHRLPPEYTTLATFHIPLAEFMEGEFEFGTVFTKDGDETKSVKSQAIDKSARKEIVEKKKAPPSPKKRDQGKEKDKKVSPRGKDTDKKGKQRASMVPTMENGEEEAPPPPLEVQIGVRLHHWKTALDSVREEEERNRVLQEKQKEQQAEKI